VADADSFFQLVRCALLTKLPATLVKYTNTAFLRPTIAAPVVRERLILVSYLSGETMDHNQARFSFRLLTRRRDQLLEELRALAPDLVEKLELTLEELNRREHDGLEQ
jgi:hypothetical protein